MIATGDDQLELGMLREAPDDTAAEYAIAAEDQDDGLRHETGV
jgi:hypothetical protein